MAALAPTLDVDAAILAALESSLAPERIVLAQAHPDYPGCICFDVEDRQGFLTTYKKWMSRHLVLNELFLLGAFSEKLAGDGYHLIFDPSCEQALQDYHRWARPLDIPGYELHDYQNFSLNKALERQREGQSSADRFYFWNWSAGAGKQAPLSEPVLTPSGWRTMGDLRPDDQVIGSDGTPTTVMAIHPQGIQPVFRVEMNDGTFSRCGAEHLWNVRRYSTRRRGPSKSGPTRKPRIEEASWKTLTTREIAQNTGRRWQLPLLAPVEFSVPEPLPMDPYVLGAYLGDGCHSGTICTDRWIVEQYGWNIFASGDRGEYTVTAGLPREIRRKIEDLGLGSARSWEKSIPEQFLTASPDDRTALLQGLLDTDGSPEPGKSTVEYCSTSLALCEGVADLVRGLGGKATLSEPRVTQYTDTTGEKIDGRESWRVHISMTAPPFRLPRKLERWRAPTKYEPVKTIVRVVDEGVSEEQVCITVSSGDGLYVTRGHNVTHNSYCSGAGVLKLFEEDRIDLVISCTLGKLKINLCRFLERAGLDAIVTDGPPKKRKEIYATPHQVYVMNFEKLRTDTEDLLELVSGRRVLFVLDEALALDTPILTNTGWKTVTTVQVGDQVPGFKGWVTVTRKTPVFTGMDCYQVTTQDDGVVTCSANHIWSVCAGEGESHLVDVNTEQLQFMVRLFESGWSRRPVRIAIPHGVEYDECDDLPLDPYLMGYWLGDGESANSHLSCSLTDVEDLTTHLESKGFFVTNRGLYGAGETVRLHVTSADATTRNGRSVRSSLIRAGVLNNKHIPDQYLTSSRRQRLELLRGLMDSDGWCATRGDAASFTQSPGALLDSVEALLRSLGYSPKKRVLKTSGFVTEEQSHQLTWLPVVGENPFFMTRKASRVRATDRISSKKITSVELVDSVPVQCIEVDSSDHLFAVGDSWMLTHNCHRLIGDGAPNQSRKALDGLTRACEATVWPMSATVVGGNPLRFRDVFSLDGHPRNNPLGTKGDFVDRYAKSVKRVPARTRNGGSFVFTSYDWDLSRIQEIRHHVADRTMAVRRHSKMPVLPLLIQATRDQRRVFDAIIDHAREAKADNPDISLIAYYRLLRQVAITPAALAVSDDPVAVEINTLDPSLAQVPSPKVEVLNGLLEEIAEAQDQAVCFVHWTTMGLHLIAPQIEAKHVVHYGAGQSARDSQKAQDDFKADPSITAFLSSDAGSHGLNMQNARYVISIDPTYSYDDLTQRNKRIDRADSHLEGLTAYVLIIEDSVEERVWRVCNARMRLAAVTQGTAEEISPEDLELAEAPEEVSLDWMIFGDGGR